MAWKVCTLVAWVLLGYVTVAHGRKGFPNPMFDAGTLTFIAMAEGDIHRIPNPVKIHGKTPAASIIARTPSPPPMDIAEPPYIPDPQTNFSIYLTNDKQFDLCFFLNLNVPSYREAPDFRVVKGNAIVVENSDFKRLARKVQEQRQRIAEGDLPTLEELNELPEDFYPLKDLSQRCVRSTPLGSGFVVSCDVEVDYPLRLFGSPVPLIDLTVMTSSNKQNVTELVEQMKVSLERGLEMVRTFGPPMPPMPPMMPQPMPFGPPPPAGGPFPGPFPGMPRPETNDNSNANRYAETPRRNSQQSSTSQAQNSQWMPFGASNRQPRNPWVPQMQGASGNMPMRTYRGQK